MDICAQEGKIAPVRKSAVFGVRNPKQMQRLRRIAPGLSRNVMSQHTQPLAAAFPGLDRWTRHRTIGAKHTAVPWLGFEPVAASLAVIEELAGIVGHGFRGLLPAVGARQRR
jgi:hypothetical protein